MSRMGRNDVGVGSIMAIGLVFVVAGALVPSEETIALGLLVALGAAAVFLGLHWPSSVTVDPPGNIVPLALARAKARARRPS